MSGSWFSESGRLALGWDSPIPAGLGLAMLSPWTVLAACVPARPPVLVPLVRAGGALLGAGLAILLAMTQSRGPILAAVVALVAGLWHAAALPDVMRRRIRCWFGGALLVLTVAVVAAGTWQRSRPDRLLEDGSVRNRIAIWQASPALLFQHPLSGLGAGESGYSYSQWYQPAETDYLYRGVFNTYLQLGIERGVPVFLLTVAVAFFLAPAWRMMRIPHTAGPVACGVVLSAQLTLLAYLVAATTSVFVAYRCLSLLALGSAGACVVSLFRWGDPRALRRGAAWAIAGAMAVTALLGALARRKQEFTVRLHSDRPVELVRNEPPADAETPVSALVFVDREVLGETYGRELRRLLGRSRRFGRFEIADPRGEFAPEVWGRAETVVLTGCTSRFMTLVPSRKDRRLVIVHPGTRPAAVSPGLVVEVWLPADDELGVGEAWRSWAAQVGAQVHSTPACGQRVREGAVPL